MVDVAGNDGAAARDLAADELRRDEGGDFGAKAFAVGERGFGALELNFAAEVLALGDVDHLFGDDAGAGEFELRDLVAVEAAQRRVVRGEGLCGMRGADIAVVFRLDVAALVFLDAAALLHPGETVARQAGVDVDGHGRIGVGAGGVVDRQVRLAGAFAEDDLAERHAQVGRGVRRGEDFSRRGKGTGGDGGKGGVGIGADVHDCILRFISVVISGLGAQRSDPESRLLRAVRWIRASRCARPGMTAGGRFRNHHHAASALLAEPLSAPSHPGRHSG